MLKLYLWIRNLLEGEEGQDLAEYALILGLVAIGSVVVLGLLSTGITRIFTIVKDYLATVKVPV